jgi:hypothetical protein
LRRTAPGIDLDVQRAMLDWDQANPKPDPAGEEDERGQRDPTTGAGKLNTDALKAAFGKPTCGQAAGAAR